MTTKATKANASPNGGAATTTEPPPDIRELVIPRPQMRHATLRIEGLSPLIMHRWSEKALGALEASQTGRAKAPRAPKQPHEEAAAAAYVVPGRENDPDQPGKFFMPAPAFKHAFLYGCSQLDDVKRFPRTRATGWVFIDADPIIDFESMVIRTDVTRSPTQVTYRPMFVNWGCDLAITYSSNAITLEQVVALFELGGVGGIGEWRPTSPKNKTGDFGRFRVAGVIG